MRRRRICHVFPAFATGGPEVRTCILINALSGEFQHTVISLNGDLSGQSRLSSRGEVCLVLSRSACGPLHRPFALASLIREQTPELVVTYGWGGTDGVLAARLSGIRRVIHIEDGFLPEEAEQQKFNRLMARRIILRLPAFVACPSERLVKVATSAWRLPRRRIRHIPNGVNAHRFVPPGRGAAVKARLQFGFADPDIVIGTVGHLRAEKNQARLLDTFASIAANTRAKLLIAGDGPLRESLAQRVRALGLENRVVFAGLVSDPLAVYQATDIFVLSSDTEQMPIAVLEAMAVGLPVVSTDVGDVKMMVSIVNRPFVVPLKDQSAYLVALSRLVNEEKSRSHLGEANREKCEREFDLSVMIENYRRIFWEVIGSRALEA